MRKKEDQTGKWRSPTGEHQGLDTGKLRALDGSTFLELTEPAAADAAYKRATRPQGALGLRAKLKRRALDDMRKLSERIKGKRPCK